MRYWRTRPSGTESPPAARVPAEIAYGCIFDAAQGFAPRRRYAPRVRMRGFSGGVGSVPVQQGDFHSRFRRLVSFITGAAALVVALALMAIADGHGPTVTRPVVRPPVAEGVTVPARPVAETPVGLPDRRAVAPAPAVKESVIVARLSDVVLKPPTIAKPAVTPKSAAPKSAAPKPAAPKPASVAKPAAPKKPVSPAPRPRVVPGGRIRRVHRASRSDDRHRHRDSRAKRRSRSC